MCNYYYKNKIMPFYRVMIFLQVSLSNLKQNNMFVISSNSD